MIYTTARKALKAFLAAGSLSQSSLAARLGIAQPSVSAWLAGTTRPQAHYREAIERIAGVPAKDWQTDDERARVDAAGQS